MFEALGIIRLVSGTTVDEQFVDESRAVPSSQLRDAIVNQLAPYLLAVIIARSEDKGHRELVQRRLQERFDVQVSDRLRVKYTLRENPSVERSVEFPKFYLRRTVIAGTGIVKESHYTLFVAGSLDVTLDQLDGDALSPIFFDGTRDDLSSLFPRIVSRFQLTGGNHEKMEEFLFTSLNIPKEVQDPAHDEMQSPPEAIPPIPVPEPPAPIIRPPVNNDKKQDITRKIDEHKDDASKRVDDFLNKLTKPIISSPKQDNVQMPQPPRSVPSGKISREQEIRGRRGEEEFLRRTRMAGGWTGFVVVKDVRAENAGYDFVCQKDGTEVKVEVKTFSRYGRVVMSANELQVAAQLQSSYFLVGFLDDDGPETHWLTSIMQDPMPDLIANGKFDIDVELQVSADALFIFDDPKKVADQEMH